MTPTGHQRGLPAPLFDQYDAATSLGGSMRQCASIGIALLTLLHLVSANAPSALAQAGSTGGTIGKQDKSISGGEETDRPRPRQIPSDRHLAASSPLVSGKYELVTGIYTSTFALTVTGSRFSGSSKWECCPGPRTDPIVQGLVQNGKISFIRECSGQGLLIACTQSYTGTITPDGASGQWTGTGGSYSWTMHKR
jgi:hypothetical protein